MLNQVEDRDVICPECCRPVLGASVGKERNDRYGRVSRSYFGHCVDCRKEFEVVQFWPQPGHPAGKRWCMHKHRYYTRTPHGDVGGNWTIVWDMPETDAAIIIGPGGDYDREVKIEPIDFLARAQRVLEAAAETLGQAVKAIGDLAKVMRVSKNLNHEAHEGHEAEND